MNVRAQSASRRIFFLAVAIVAFAATIVVRIRFLGLPLERDEGEYAYSGQLLLQRIAPYTLAYNMKFPGTYGAYALLMAIFGQSNSGIHLGLLLVNFASSACLFLIARRSVGFEAGAVAAAFHAVLSVSPWVAGLYGHATHFVVLCVLAGTAILVTSSRVVAVLGAGILFGAAILMKQPGALFAPFGAAVVIWQANAQKVERRGITTRVALFVLGCAVPVFLLMLGLRLAGVFDRFWFWTVEYARSYGTMMTPSDGLTILRAQLPAIVGWNAAIWGLAAIGLCLLFFRSATRGLGIVLAIFLVCSAAAVCPGFYFREHYFLLLLPVIALVAGIAVTWPFEQRWAGAALVAATGIAMALPLAADRQLLFATSPADFSRALYWPNPFVEAERVGEFLRQHSEPSDTIAVLGSEPEIYFYARRHSATGYIYSYPLMEPHERAPMMQREMIAEIEKNRPRFLVIVGSEPSWLRRPSSDQAIFEWANGYCAREFDLVGMVSMPSRARSDYLLPISGPVEAPGPNHLLVYERRR